MRITIISVGKFDNSPLKAVFENYLKRLKWKIELKEIEQRSPKNITSAQLKNLEAELILKTLKPSSKIISLDENGKQFTSRNFAKLISDSAINGDSDLTFIIGGSDGLGENILQKSYLKMSLGLMTFPHLMARTILVEQIYRAQTIIENHPYHRD